jgi:hypothetical protein
MRVDAEPFRSRNAAPVKYPRAVVQIEFEVESIYLTSHPNIDAIPGVLIDNVLQAHAAISQKIIPDEARSEIGTFSFSIIDKDSAFTDAIRTRLLDDGYGLRGKTVRLYIGYAEALEGDGSSFGEGAFGSGLFGGGTDYPDASFDDFGLFQTQIITGASYDAGTYRINCADITREQREDIFEPKTTTLRTALTDSATTVEVYDTTKFQLVSHGTSYSDAPSATVGYIKIEKEVIRYTGKTGDSFTGCTRGALNTKAVAHTFDTGADEERRPKIEEYIYLEEPGVKLAYKILTGKDPLTGVDCWPPHWHCGIDPDLITLSDFTGIGDDLWATSDDTAGFVPYFSGLKKVTGKRFLESEIYVLLGCYSPVYADGTLGLKRMNQVLADSASVIELTEDNLVSWSELRHEYGLLHNRIRIDWNWNGEEFTRNTLFIDQASIDIHGEAPVKTYQFKGLHGSRHTDSLIRLRIDCIRDRYSQPPETITVQALPSLNILEVGDIPRANVSTIRDFAAEGDNINRSFEVQQARYDFSNGDVSLDLFGSTSRASTLPPTSDTTALPDAFYTDRGTELSTVATIVVTGGVGIIQPGTYTLTGDPDVNDDDAIFYYDGDLQLAAGATLVIEDNVQIRHNGFFQINGTIDGAENGKAGVAPSNVYNAPSTGVSGFVGNSRGWDGIRTTGSLLIEGAGFFISYSIPTTQGQYAAFPYLDITIDGNDIIGIPADLRGTSGGQGGDVWRVNTNALMLSGGSGAASGAGLVLIGKGLAFGGAGSIDLSGADSAATTTVDSGRMQAYSGSGGAGGPGALLILIDGGSISLPDLSGHFTAATGEVPQLGTPIITPGPVSSQSSSAPVAGWNSPSVISNANLSNAAHRIQYIPASQTPAEDEGDRPAAPTALSATGSINKITLRATVDLIPGDRVEYYTSATNDRTTATRIAYGAFTDPEYPLATGLTRYNWCRVRRVQDGVDLFSEWFPESSTGGISVTSPSNGATDIVVATLSTDTDTFTDTGEVYDECGVYYKNETAVTISVEISYSLSTTVTSDNATTDVYRHQIRWAGALIFPDGITDIAISESNSEPVFLGSLIDDTMSFRKTYVDVVSLDPEYAIDIDIAVQTLADPVMFGDPLSTTVTREAGVLRVTAVKL